MSNDWVSLYRLHVAVVVTRAQIACAFSRAWARHVLDSGLTDVHSDEEVECR